MFNRSTLFRIILMFILLAGVIGITSVQASPNIAGKTPIGTPVKDNCIPNDGWMWTDGPARPEVAAQVQKKLSDKGTRATVEARSYGETDSCGTYQEHGIDFTVSLPDAALKNKSDQQAHIDHILPVLKEFGKPNLGNVKLISAGGEVISVEASGIPSSVQALDTATLPADAITKKVYVIVYDPLLSNGQKLSEYEHWNSAATITQQTVDFFSQATNSKMNYSVVDTTVVTSGWPELIDGFAYTESQYLAVLANPSLHHEPTDANYNKIVNSAQFDICGKLDRGEIDEVWIYNGPWFGFYESRLVGPGAFVYNSSPISGSHNCNRLLPIMGPSPERTVNEAVHNFTHRSEATMSKVYGGWQENRTAHNWDKFALVKAQSPNYSYSGCGSSHYPPNAVTGYDYSNSSNVVPSNCDDFANYPNLSDPLQVAQPITCSTWNCMEIQYYGYWFGHFPKNTGCGPDNVSTDWWRYLSNPGMALYPSAACQADTRIISGNVGAGGTILSYTDGTAKSVTADSYGNYFLVVSNHWSGNVTPARAGYTFGPASKAYSDVQSDLYTQDYEAQGTGQPAYFVNIATGNNNNSCTSANAPCRNIQEAINKATAGDSIKVASGTYLFSTNGSPNVVIINKDLNLSGGWNSDFSAQDGASIIDGVNVNNGVLVNSGTVKVDNFVVQNSVSQNSGAIYIVNGNFTLSKSTLRNNTAYGNGAGIFLDNGVLSVINSTISGNHAGSMGGGIYASYNSGTSVTIQNSTIAYNYASTGGGISRTNGVFNLTNTIIANNSGSDCYGTLSTANNNIIKNMTGCSITSGNQNLNTDPKIDSNLTAVMPVHMLLSGSPAIDAGTASGCPATDQIGTARPQSSSCDIGSIEYAGPIGDTIPPVVVSVTRASPDPTLASKVDFNVNFSEAVTGVDASDFRLTANGLTGTSIASASGSESSYIVSVNTGSGSGMLRLDVIDNDSIVDTSSNPLGGPGVDNGNFTTGEVYTVPQKLTLTLNSIAANDGWVLESSENSNIGGTLNATTNTFNVGDDKANKQYMGILHFDTSSLPDTAVITSVTLKVRKQGVTGTDPFTTYGGLLVDIQQPYFGTTAGLVASDFQATAGRSTVSTFNPNPVNNWYSATVDSAGYIYINLAGTTQFRLRFSLDDNNNKREDSVKFYSGDGTAANRPQIIIQYYIP